jgi:phenylpropionate dioxygenase-like ring-hydroxylating dioxygenase large terminal subunit
VLESAVLALFAVYGEIEFECGHWGVFENAIDMAHIHYLHGDSFGNADKPAVMDMTTTRDTFETACNFRYWVRAGHVM